VRFAGDELVPAVSMEHYQAAPDQVDPDRRIFPNKFERVVGEFFVSLCRTILLDTFILIEHSEKSYGMHYIYMQDFYRAELGQEAAVQAQVKRACAKLIKDLRYESRVQAVVDYNHKVLRSKIDRKEAKKIHLTADQYMQVNVDIISILSEIK
jgi:hypothetical protein